MPQKLEDMPVVRRREDGVVEMAVETFDDLIERLLTAEGADNRTAEIALNWFFGSLVEAGIATLGHPKWGNYLFGDGVEIDSNTLHKWKTDAVIGAAALVRGAQ